MSYQKLLQEMGADDVGADDMGYAMGYSISGELEGDLEGEDVVGRDRRRVVIPRSRPRRDRYDRVYSGAMAEHGQALPQMTLALQESQLVAGDTFTLSANAPQAFVLTTLTVNANAATYLTNVQFLVGGQPVASFAGYIDLSRFVSGSFDKRLPPSEIPAGTPILITGVVNAAGPAAPNNFYRIEVAGAPIRSSLTFASR